MSHTPGPWTTDSRPEATVEIAVVESAAFDAIEVYAGRSATSVEEHVGTARLIAAAPDLLASLKECSFRLATLVAATGDFSEVHARALDAATAALAKAEG